MADIASRGAHLEAERDVQPALHLQSRVPDAGELHLVPGPDPGPEPWWVAIQHPRSRKPTQERLDLQSLLRRQRERWLVHADDLHRSGRRIGVATVVRHG